MKSTGEGMCKDTVVEELLSFDEFFIFIALLHQGMSSLTPMAYPKTLR